MAHRNTAEQRQRIAEAAERVIARTGVDLISLRRVATEAGLTTGAIQHHFGTKERLIGFVLERQGDRIGRRLTERASRSPAGPPSPRRVLTAIITELLPLDEERRREAAVSLAFAARAQADDDGGLAAAFREAYPRLRNLIAEQFRAARSDIGDRPEGRDSIGSMDSTGSRGSTGIGGGSATTTSIGDAVADADLLLCVIDGLRSNLLLGQSSPAEARRLADRALDRLLAAG